MLKNLDFEKKFLGGGEKSALSEKGVVKKANIELWRFLLTIGVAIMHFGYFNGFYIAVDFFFMLSGYLVCISVCKRGYNKSGLTILINKVKRLFPHYFVAFMLMLIWNVYCTGIVFNRDYIVDTIVELLGGVMLLKDPQINNGITWYISAMILCMPVIIYLLKNFRHSFLCIISPVVAVLIYGYLLSTYGHVDFTIFWSGLFNLGLLRAMGGLCAGAFIFYLSEHYSERIGEWKWISIIELIVGFLIIITAIFCRQTRLDYILLPSCAMLILLAFNDFGWLNCLTSNKIVIFFGKISYPIYLYQLFVSGIVMKAFIWIDDKRILTVLYVAVLIIFSAILESFISLVLDKVKLEYRIGWYISCFVLFWVVSFMFGKIDIVSLGNVTYSDSQSTVTSAISDLHCSIDYCNKVSVLQDNQYELDGTEESICLEGWAEKVSTMELVDSITVLCNNKEFEATLLIERADVAETLCNDELLYSGWEVVIPIQDIIADDDGVISVCIAKGNEKSEVSFSFVR